MKKFELTEEKIIVYGGDVLYRIKALKNFADVKIGDLGGFVEKENNLSHDGNCWIYDNAKIFGNAKIYDDAKIYGDAKVFGKAEIFGKAYVYEKAKISGKAKIYNNASVFGKAKIYGTAEIFGDAKIFGNVKIFRNAELFGDAEITNNTDFMVFKNTWSSGKFFTYTRSNKMWKVGSFYGTSEQLIEKAYKDSELSGNCYKDAVEFAESFYEYIENNNNQRNK